MNKCVGMGMCMGMGMGMCMGVWEGPTAVVQAQTALGVPEPMSARRDRHGLHI